MNAQIRKDRNNKFCLHNLTNRFEEYFVFPGGFPRGIMVKAMECGIVVSEFEVTSRYYSNFWTNTIGKGMNPLILPAMA